MFILPDVDVMHKRERWHCYDYFISSSRPIFHTLHLHLYLPIPQNVPEVFSWFICSLLSIGFWPMITTRKRPKNGLKTRNSPLWGSRLRMYNFLYKSHYLFFKYLYCWEYHRLFYSLAQIVQSPYKAMYDLAAASFSDFNSYRSPPLAHFDPITLALQFLKHEGLIFIKSLYLEALRLLLHISE